MATPATVSASGWYLEGSVDGGKRTLRVVIRSLPFRIGRRPGLDLTLSANSISKDHAEIVFDGANLRIRDLASTNGTFVNHQRLSDEAVLAEGDVVHFAEFGFRLGQLDSLAGEALGTLALTHLELPQVPGADARNFAELLKDAAVSAVFQPIVSLPEGRVVGYEALGRGRHPALPESPHRLFEIAAHLGVEARLSRVFRARSLEACASLPRGCLLFLNTHPVELAEPGLVESLVEPLSRARGLALTLEIHERAVTDLATIRALKARLTDLGIGLAYDDFGAGQARLVELADVPPDYLKFDLRLVRGIHSAPAARQRLLETLVRMALDLGAKPVAEGIENREDAATCVQLGFTFGQGNLYGAPSPAGDLPRPPPA